MEAPAAGSRSAPLVAPATVETNHNNGGTPHGSARPGGAGPTPRRNQDQSRSPTAHKRGAHSVRVRKGSTSAPGKVRRGLPEESSDSKLGGVKQSIKSSQKGPSTWYDFALDVLDDLTPQREERYSIWCLVLGGAASLLCFLPFYTTGTVGSDDAVRPVHFHLGHPAPPLEAAVNSTEFNVALLLSVVIAIPMLLDVAFDAVYVFLPGSGRKLHWFVRVFLLAALTVPSLLLLAPTTFPTGNATVEGYLCVQSFKRLATITCLFGYISHEKADGEGGEGGGAKKDASRRLGLLSVLTLASYLAYELFWLYAYTAGSGTNQGLSASNPLRATGAFFLVLCAVQVLHIIAIWSWRFVGPHAMALRKACASLVNALLRRVHRRAAPDEVSRAHSPDDNLPGAEGGGGGGGGGGRSVKTGAGKANDDTASPDKALVDLDAFFKGKRPAWTSRDITMALYFAAMVLIPALGLVISKACGNPGINSLTATAREISGYVYLQMAFTTLVFVLPAYLARYELFYAMRALSEKENFIAQVSVEVRNPLNDVLINISSVQNDISALQPKKGGPNSAAEREIFASVVDTINEIKHSTEVALSTFTDLITVNRLDKGQAKLDKQDTHPWRYFRDVARPFEMEARHKRVGFGMTCLEFTSGWPDEHFVRIDRHKISQVLRTLVLCSFKATPAGGNVHITLAIVDNETGQARQPHASQTSHHGDGAALGALAPVAALLSHAVGGLFRRGNVAPTIDPASSKTGGSRTNRRNAQTSSQQAGHWLVLELHDTGKALHRREIDGSLLRLRACRAMVEAHKGVMRVFPRPNDRGATFQIRLPMLAFVQPGSQGQSRHSSAMAQSIRLGGGAGAGGGPGTTVMRRLEQRGSRGSDASSQDSDRGMFGMRNDFDVGAPAAEEGNADLDWFVPAFNVDLNAPPSMHGSGGNIAMHQHRQSGASSHSQSQHGTARRLQSGSMNRGQSKRTSRQFLTGFAALAGSGGSNKNSEHEGRGGAESAVPPSNVDGDPAAGLPGLFSAGNSDAGSGSGLMGNIADLFGQLGAAFGAAPGTSSRAGSQPVSRASSSRRLMLESNRKHALSELDAVSSRVPANGVGSSGGGDGPSRSGSMVPSASGMMQRATSSFKRNLNRSNKSQSPHQSPMGSVKAGLGLRSPTGSAKGPRLGPPTGQGQALHSVVEESSGNDAVAAVDCKPQTSDVGTAATGSAGMSPRHSTDLRAANTTSAAESRKAAAATTAAAVTPVPPEPVQPARGTAEVQEGKRP